jgi:hypothetical protein
MKLEAAQSLVKDLGKELGGTGTEYQLDDHGEALLVMDDNLPLLIRHVDEVMVLAVIVAQGVDGQDPTLFGTLMDYQFMGLRTNGFGLSWNPSTECLQLSAHLRGEPSVTDLATLLSTILTTGMEVRDELATLIAFRRSLQAEMAADDAADGRAEPVALQGSSFASIRG